MFGFENLDGPMARATAIMINVTNLAWMSRIAKAAHDDLVPFESPRDMEKFRDATTFLAAAIILNDHPASRAMLIGMGIEEGANMMFREDRDPMHGEGRFLAAMEEGKRQEVPFPPLGVEFLREVFVDCPL